MNEKVLLLTEIKDGTFMFSMNTPLAKDRLSKLSIKTEYVPKAKEKIYIYPDADIPKFKVKPFCDKYDVSLVRDKSKANQKFIGGTFIDDLYEKNNKHYYSVNNEIFTEWFKRVIYESDSKHTAFLKQLENNKGKPVYYTYNIMRLITTAYKGDSNDNPFGIPLHEKDKYPDSIFLSIMDKNTEDLVNELEASDNLYSSECMLKYMNGQALMDEQMYINIKNLFKSSDSGNHILAIETMANCDYIRSSVYLLLLIKEFGELIRCSKASKHVNFTALKTFFDIRPYGNMYTEHLVNILSKKGLLTEGRLAILMTEIEREAKEKWGDSVTKLVGIAPTENILDNVCINPEEIVDIVQDYGEELNLEC